MTHSEQRADGEAFQKSYLACVSRNWLRPPVLYFQLQLGSTYRLIGISVTIAKFL